MSTYATRDARDSRRRRSSSAPTPPGRLTFVSDTAAFASESRMPTPACNPNTSPRVPSSAGLCTGMYFVSKSPLFSDQGPNGWWRRRTGDLPAHRGTCASPVLPRCPNRRWFLWACIQHDHCRLLRCGASHSVSPLRRPARPTCYRGGQERSGFVVCVDARAPFVTLAILFWGCDVNGTRRRATGAEGSRQVLKYGVRTFSRTLRQGCHWAADPFPRWSISGAG